MCCYEGTDFAVHKHYFNDKVETQVCTSRFPVRTSTAIRFSQPRRDEGTATASANCLNKLSFVCVLDSHTEACKESILARCFQKPQITAEASLRSGGTIWASPNSRISIPPNPVELRLSELHSTVRGLSSEPPTEVYNLNSRTTWQLGAKES